MNAMKGKFVLLLLIAGVLSACASPATQATQAPASQSTETTAPATEAPTSTVASATDTSVPTAESSATSEASTGATVSFANDVLPLLESRCINCHGGDKTEEGLSLKSYSDIFAGSENGSVVAAGDVANSPLAQMVVSQKMPKRGPKLTPAQTQLIVDWINQGALDN